MNIDGIEIKKNIVKTNGLEVLMKDFTDLMPSIRALATITRKVYLGEDLTMPQLIALNELCDYGVVLHHKDILANVEEVPELDTLVHETNEIKKEGK